MKFFATCARALEPLLADELRSFGATSIEPTRAGVSFEGNLGAGVGGDRENRKGKRQKSKVKSQKWGSR